MKRKLLVTLFALIIPSIIFAGWVQTDSEGDETKISDGKIKFNIDDNGSFMVVDFNDGGLLMVNPQKKIFTDITINDYCAFMSQLLQSLEQDDEESEGLQANIENEGREEIAGITCNHYKIYVDGEIYEELWIADNPEIMKETGKAAYRRDFTTCGPSDLEALSNLEEYNELLYKGWEMKSVSYFDGRPDVDHLTVKMEKKDIPASEFKAPSGFSKVDFQAYLLQQE